jgi:hypothetical protein
VLCVSCTRRSPRACCSSSHDRDSICGRRGSAWQWLETPRRARCVCVRVSRFLSSRSRHRAVDADKCCPVCACRRRVCRRQTSSRPWVARHQQCARHRGAMAATPSTLLCNCRRACHVAHTTDVALLPPSCVCVPLCLPVSAALVLLVLLVVHPRHQRRVGRGDQDPVAVV